MKLVPWGIVHAGLLDFCWWFLAVEGLRDTFFFFTPLVQCLHCLFVLLVTVSTFKKLMQVKFLLICHRPDSDVLVIIYLDWWSVEYIARVSHISHVSCFVASSQEETERDLVDAEMIPMDMHTLGFFSKFWELQVSVVIHGLTLKVLVTTIDAQWEGMGDVGSARYEPALLPPCPTIRILCYSN